MKTAIRKTTEVVTTGAALYWELARSALRLLPRSDGRGAEAEPVAATPTAGLRASP